jgi:hypothetical protein
MSIPETFLFASLVLTFGASAQSELTPIAAGESVEKTVGQRLCFAGRFSVLTAAGDDGRSKLRCLEQVSSSAGHPNAAKLDEVVIVLRPDSLFRPEAGRAHCLILMEGSKSSLSVVGFGPDDVAREGDALSDRFPKRSPMAGPARALGKVPQGREAQRASFDLR